MSDERYAPPSAPLVHEVPLGAGGEFTIEQALRDGWRLTWANFGLLLGVMLVGSLLIFASVITLVGVFLIAPVLFIGMIRLSLQIVDGGGRFDELWSGFRNYGHSLGGVLGIYLAILAIGFIGAVPVWIAQAIDNAGLIILGQLGNSAFSLFVGSRLIFAIYHVADQSLGPLEALQRSWDETSNLKLRTAGLSLVSGLLGLAGMLVLLIGIIPALMIAQLAMASAYRQLVPRARSAAA